ncbi:MAG: leucine-rich repeat domain-containing protein [Christensenellales bacterium]|jgi:hypothetical protein
MKRALLLTFALLLLAVLPSPAAVQAEELLTSGDYEYRILEDGTAEIARCYGATSYPGPPLTIPGNLDGLPVTSIGNRAFFGLLTGEIIIPEGVTSIGSEAFEMCSKLTVIIIPNSVTRIGDRAFNGCESLATIVHPDGINDAKNNPFVAFLDGITDIGDNPFVGCTSLNQAMVHPDHPTLATIDGVLFSKADKRLIWYPMARKDTAYEVPQGILKIGTRAFFGCENLKNISVPNSVTDIGDNPFAYCAGLKQIAVRPDHPALATIDGALFNKADKRLLWYPMVREDTAYEIPQGILSIGNDAFFSCSNLISITIPDSVTSIGNGAFSRCENLIRITIPGSVTSIGNEAFYGCGDLISIIIPNGVTSIGDRAFSWCEKLTSITIPDSVTSIGNEAFTYCWDLASIAIPKSVTSIGDGAFGMCSSLMDIAIPDSVTSIGIRAFYECSNLAVITIPDSVTSIGYEAFEECKSLEKVIVAADSYAQRYCEENGLPFVYQENTDWLNN